MNIARAGKFALQFIKRNSPIILSVAAGIGLAALYILTIKETEEVVHEIEEAPEEEAHSFKMVKKTVKIMAPSFVILLLTMFCIVQSCRISQHRIRDLTQYSAMLAATLNQYRQKNREILGPDGSENNDKFIMYEIASENMPDELPDDPEDGILCELIGYPHYFKVPKLENIYAGFLNANEYMETGWGSVELSKLFRWINAIHYDDKGHRCGMDVNYLHYGWETHDLADCEKVSGLYPYVGRITEDSGLVVYLIDVPAPKPLDVSWEYGI